MRWIFIPSTRSNWRSLKETCRPRGSMACRACIPGSWRCWTIARHRRSGAVTPPRLICSSLMPAGKAIARRGRAFASADAGDMRAAATIATGRCLALWSARTTAARRRGAFFFVPRREYRDRRYLAGLRPAGHGKLGRDRRRGVFVPAYRTQSMLDNFLLKGPGPGAEYVEPLSIAVRSDFRPRHFDRGAGGVAAACSTRSWTTARPRDARGRAVGGKPFRSAALRRNGGGHRRDEEHLASQLSAICTPMQGGARRRRSRNACGTSFNRPRSLSAARLLAARIFKATGAAGLSEDLPFGGILADLMAGRQHISNQYEYVGSSWGGVMFGLENKDLMI